MNSVKFKATKNSIREYYKTLTRDSVLAYFSKSNNFLTQNTKLSKGNNYNIGLELIPSNLCKCSVNLCGKETECIKTCLVFTGKGNLLNQRKMFENGKITPILSTRTKRTWLYINERELFLKMLESSLVYHQSKAELLGKQFAVRLNVFSDIDWSSFAVSHPTMQFYDYTKYWDRQSLSNYNITYSFNEKVSVEDVKAKIDLGQNVAMVFNSTILPETWYGVPVVNGDESDSRYDDIKGVIIGLVLKTPIGKKEERIGSKFLRVA